jgi:hypothetical protein
VIRDESTLKNISYSALLKTEANLVEQASAIMVMILKWMQWQSSE